MKSDMNDNRPIAYIMHGYFPNNLVYLFIGLGYLHGVRDHIATKKTAWKDSRDNKEQTEQDSFGMLLMPIRMREYYWRDELKQIRQMDSISLVGSLHDAFPTNFYDHICWKVSFFVYNISFVCRFLWCFIQII